MNDYLAVFIFIVMALGFTAAGLITAYLVRTSRPSLKKNETYECGEEPVGGAWIQFNMRYYVFALLFVVFDVEAVFLFPWAVVFKSFGVSALVELLVFLGILLAGLLYAWKKGSLQWE